MHVQIALRRQLDGLRRDGAHALLVAQDVRGVASLRHRTHQLTHPVAVFAQRLLLARDPVQLDLFQVGRGWPVRFHLVDFGKGGGDHLVHVFGSRRQVQGHRIMAVRMLAHRGFEAAAVDHAHLFTQHFDDFQVQHLAQCLQGQLLLVRIRHVAIEGDGNRALGLATHVDILLDDPGHRAHAHVAVGVRHVAHGQGAQVAGDQRLDLVELEAARKDEGHVARAGKALAEDVQRAVQAHLVEVGRARHAIDARVVAKHGVLDGIVKHGFRLRHAVFRQVLLLADEGLVQARVLAYVIEIQIHQLQHGFHVGAAGRAAKAFAQFAQRSAHIDRLSGQHLLQVQRRQVFQAPCCRPRRWRSGRCRCRRRQTATGRRSASSPSAPGHS